ncbi:hypothetical protein GCM10011518_03340 [Flavobacterium limi]|uniref:Uncharacterized protein n=1 Tax=Flavobacterium limi TaxID=2045105 RepID=A0ABQ1TJX5_9FLAO|nr:hypothetical protein GCM10011518_03340 [Flavobacterium limi]
MFEFVALIDLQLYAKVTIISNIKYFFMSDILELNIAFGCSVRIIMNMLYLNLRKIVQIKKLVNNELAFM